jgi:hypothetical protein
MRSNVTKELAGFPSVASSKLAWIIARQAARDQHRGPQSGGAAVRASIETDDQTGYGRP